MSDIISKFDLSNSFEDFLRTGNCAWVGCNRSENALRRLNRNVSDGWIEKDLNNILNDKDLLQLCENIFQNYAYTDLENIRHYIINELFLGIAIRTIGNEIVAIISDPLGNCLTSTEKADLEQKTGQPFEFITEEILHQFMQKR